MDKLTDKDSANNDADEDRRQFFQRLQALEPSAIRHLAQRIDSFLSTASIRNLVDAEDRKEITNDAVFITLKKIREGAFQPTQAAPATFAIAIARNLVGNRLQKKQIKTDSLHAIKEAPGIDFSPEELLQNKEREKMLGQLLNQLDDSCRQIILLRYFDEISDEEAVRQKLTAHTTTDSLKSKRSKCLKAMAKLMEPYKNRLLLLV